MEDLGIDGMMILKKDLKDVGWKGMDCIRLAQDGQLARCCEYGNEPAEEL
jgi:hypothetical protein